MFCKNCGTPIAGNAKFCDNCGAQSAAEQTNIQAQMTQTRRKNPPPYKKNAVIVTIILWVVGPIAALIASEGEPIFIWIICGVLAVVTVFTWIMCMYSYSKYMKSTDSHDINRKM